MIYACQQRKKTLRYVLDSYITLHYRHLVDTLIHSDLHNFLHSIYSASIYTAGYILK
uniref:Uncharacterized protein n=1 Tax=Anguilla anguilla TaxID=7936 RepID=A0A0E9RZW1_ANGAN